ncbi:hypothetical protein ACLOJK_033796 [Asimina triloba]
MCFRVYGNNPRVQSRSEDWACVENGKRPVGDESWREGERAIAHVEWGRCLGFCGLGPDYRRSEKMTAAGDSCEPEIGRNGLELAFIWLVKTTPVRRSGGGRRGKERKGQAKGSAEQETKTLRIGYRGVRIAYGLRSRRFIELIIAI